MLAGFTLLCVGVYRQVPLTFDTKGIRNQLPAFVMLIFACYLIYHVYKAGGKASLFESGRALVTVASGLLPTIVMFFMCMALCSILIRLRRAEIQLEIEKGLFGTFVAAFLIPSSNTVATMVAELWKNTKLRPRLTWFLVFNPSLSLTVLGLRQAGLGTPITAIMYVASLLCAIATLPIVRLIEYFIERR